MPTMDQVSFSPIRKVFFPTDIPPWFSPYGGSRAFNVLDSFLAHQTLSRRLLIKHKSISNLYF